jgi:hypothetical protein
VRRTGQESIRHVNVMKASASHLKLNSYTKVMI